MTREEFIEALDGSSSDPRRSYGLIWDEIHGQDPLVPKKPRWRRKGDLLYDGDRKGDNWCCELLNYNDCTDLDEAGLERARDAIVDLLNAMEEEG